LTWGLYKREDKPHQAMGIIFLEGIRKRRKNRI
jgi:hypothetical protein